MWTRGGSSPLAWGTPTQCEGIRSMWRFIPTRVGNTSRSTGSTGPTPVHPHSRGEHLHAHIQRHARARFIPNRVGNTCSCTSRPTSPTVHPHSRGEHLSAATTNQQLSGSSPLAWGTRSACPTHRTQSRFIPTRVGNTQAESVGAPPRPVHPHSRGEHASRTESAILLAGSSPLAWGTRAGHFQLVGGRRFIPTRVGNTCRRRFSRHDRTVHPHSRGEHSSSSPLFYHANLSPLKSTEYFRRMARFRMGVG